MRRYLQGTLDFACGIYAVINALACTHNLDLARARVIFQETLFAISAEPDVWNAFVRNSTDHYWVIRYMMRRWCLSVPEGRKAYAASPFRLRAEQPFGEALLPSGKPPALDKTHLYLPERTGPGGPASVIETLAQAAEIWRSLDYWFNSGPPLVRRAAVFRFHRFLPGVGQPVVSHWTAAQALSPDLLELHDASAEQGALLQIPRVSLIPTIQERPLVRIVPESLLLLETIS